jgi:fatty-acyl-CoA synthase
VVLRAGAEVSAADLRAFLGERVPRWQLPERWSFIDEVPKTSVGKFAKTRMRDSYARGEYEVVEVR